MTQTGTLFMAEDRQALSDRLASFLRQRYPLMGRDKLLARDIGCDPRAARNYFEGHWPNAAAFRGIVRQFGRDFLAAVFDPDIDEVHAALEAEVRRLETELEARKTALRCHQNTAPGVAPTEGRAP